MNILYICHNYICICMCMLYIYRVVYKYIVSHCSEYKISQLKAMRMLRVWSVPPMSVQMTYRQTDRHYFQMGIMNE